ncbi:MAG: hypothetical protein ACK53L_07730, partial [Pirellulaceae bacterium]
ILDVNLDNAADMANSFAIRWGNNFIVNDNGRLLGAFGDLMPPREAAFDPLFGRRTTNQSQSSSSFADAIRDTVVGTGANAAETGSRSSTSSSARNSSESSSSRQS